MTRWWLNMKSQKMVKVIMPLSQRGTWTSVICLIGVESFPQKHKIRTSWWHQSNRIRWYLKSSRYILYDTSQRSIKVGVRDWRAVLLPNKLIVQPSQMPWYCDLFVLCHLQCWTVADKIRYFKPPTLWARGGVIVWYFSQLTVDLMINCWNNQLIRKYLQPLSHGLSLWTSL